MRPGPEQTIGSPAPELAIIAGSGHVSLAADLARLLRLTALPVVTERFPDGELSVRIGQSVGGRQAVIVQPTGPPVDEHLVELLALADACRRSAAARVVAVVPYFGYARGDRRAGPGTPVMASLVAQLMQRAGIDQVITFDLHAPQIEGFFQVPLDELSALPLLLPAVREGFGSDVVVVSPDLGRLGLAALYADQLGTTAAVVHKRRTSGRESHVLQVAGEVAGRPCLIVDDMIATGGTIAGCVDALLHAGAQPRIAIAATHGLFLAGSAELLGHPAVGQIWVTDTLPQAAGPPPRSVLSVAPLLAAALLKLR